MDMATTDQVGRSEFARSVHTQYSHIVAAQGERPFSYVHFCSSLSYLQSIGLVALIAAKVGRTYANRILLTFDRDILEPIWQLRQSR